MSKFPLGLIGLDFTGKSVFEAASNYSFEWVELYQGVNIEENEADDILSLKQQFKVQIVSISSLVKLNQAEEDVEEQIKVVKNGINMAARVGAPFSTFMYGGNSHLDREAARERFLQRVSPLIEEAIKNNVTLLIENVFSRVPPGDLDCAEFTFNLMEQLDNRYVGLAFDPANFAIGGEEAYPLAYRLLKKHIKYIHLKDAVKYRPEWHGDLQGRRPLIDYQRGRHISVPPGQGVVNYEGLLPEIIKDGYRGVIGLEPFANGAHCDIWIKQALNYFESHGLYRKDFLSI